MDPAKLVELTPAEFAAVIALFLPGFVSLRIDRLIHPHKDAALGQNVIEILGYSLLNAGVLSWAILAASRQLASPTPEYLSLASLTALVCLIGPVLWPVLLRVGQRWAARRGWILSGHRTAWDDVFSRREPCWIVLHLADHTLIGGYFGKSSHASTGAEFGHIYIEELWVLDADGTFIEPVPESKGAIFRPTDYVWIEMRKDD